MLTRYGLDRAVHTRLQTRTQCSVQTASSAWMHKLFVSPVHSNGRSQLYMQIFVQHTWYWSTGFVLINWQSGISCHWVPLSVSITSYLTLLSFPWLPQIFRPRRRQHRCSQNVCLLVIHLPDNAAIPRKFIEFSHCEIINFFFYGVSTLFRISASQFLVAHTIRQSPLPPITRQFG